MRRLRSEVHTHCKNCAQSRRTDSEKSCINLPQHLLKHKSWETPHWPKETHSSFRSLTTQLKMSFLKRLVICQQTTLASNSSALLKHSGRRMTFFNICPNSGPPSRDAKLLESRLNYLSGNVPVSQTLTKRLKTHQHLTHATRTQRLYNQRVWLIIICSVPNGRGVESGLFLSAGVCLCSSGLYRVTVLPLERIRRVV